MRDILVRSVNESYEAELSQLDLPVHLLWGETDSEVPVAVAHAAKEILGESATIEVIEGVGHHIPLNSPERLRSVVVAMLERTG